VEGSESADGVAEVAGFAVEVNGGEARLGCGGNPPAAELRLTGCGGGEADGFEGEIYVCGSSRDRGSRVVEQLPTALPEEDAEGAPRAEEGGSEDNGKSAEKPLPGDCGGRRILTQWRALRCGWRSGGGARLSGWFRLAHVLFAC
jgi:hypothetical protein